MHQLLEKTSSFEQQLASSFINALEHNDNEILTHKREAITLNIQGLGSVEIPLKAFLFLKNILSSMAEGKSIAVLESETELSTQQAADILHISRPHLVKLLENGAIPFKKVGSHRRVLLKDILYYENEMQETQIENLQILADEAQKYGLGYE